MSSFDSIPHDKLLACVRMRVVDRSVLQLIRMWLETPVIEPGEGGKPERWTRPRKGTPQGGVISPLLSNLYLHWFDKLFHRAEGLPSGRGPSWCVMPMISWCWRAIKGLA